MEDNKLVITMESKMFHFDLPKCADINLRHETYSIIKQKKTFSNGHEVRQLMSKFIYGNNIYEH